MPVPSMRAIVVRVALLIVLVGAGVAVWYFVIRDEGASQVAEKEPEKEKREQVSDDPLVRSMSVAEQAQQVLMLGFVGDPGAVPGGLGAVLVRSENGIGAAKALAQVGGEIPPLVVASQEGGIYRSFPELPAPERELDIGRSRAPDAALVWSQATSKALADAGFDLNLFPVADVATLDSPLAGRAFSDDPAQVAVLTEEAIQGCEDAGIACAPLHFPGLGAGSQDTADGPATISSPIEVLSNRDMVPFRAVADDVPAMVLSLGLYPDFDAAIPGAMTEGIATGLLRDDIGFDGVAISDDLGSGAVAFPPEEAAVRAIAAGTDLVQFGAPEDAVGVAEAIEQAVEDGEIEPERLAEAAERVLDLKRELGLVTAEPRRCVTLNHAALYIALIYLLRYMDLSPTGRVILGVLAVEPRSGYDIKALTDKSTRFFWAASYGQIYPELKRLAEQGLIEGSDEPQGGRKRTVYSHHTRRAATSCADWLETRRRSTSFATKAF